MLGPGVVCHWCGSTATQLDHLIEVDRGGDPFDPGNLVPACKPCNSRRGAEYKNAKYKGTERRAGNAELLERVRAGALPGYIMGTTWWADCERCGKAFMPHHKSAGRYCSRACVAKGDRPIIGASDDAPRPLLLGISEEQEEPADAPGSAGIAADTAEEAKVAPRLEVGPMGSASLGAEVVAWAKTYLGVTLMPWQAHVLDRLLQVDEQGRTVVRQSLVSVARQNGKTRGLLQPLIGWALTEWPRHRGSPVTCTLVSHALDLSVATFTDVAVVLEEMFGGKAKWSYGRNEVRMPDGSLLLVQAATGNAGHGRSNDLVIVDECWDVADTVIDQGLIPSQRARPHSLLLAVSTAGTEASAWMLRMREAGLRAIDTGEVGTYYFAEWSVPSSVDAMDPRYWPLANPALGYTIDMDTLVAESKAPSRSMFLRASLNQWVASDRAWVEPGVWERLEHVGELGDPTVLVVDSSQDGGRHVGLFAWDLGNGEAVVDVAFTVKSETEAWAEVERLMRPSMRLAITPSLEIHLPRQFERQKVIVGYVELLKWTGLIRSMVIDGRVRHRGSRQLADQVERAVAVTTKNGYALSSQKSPGPIELTRCMVWAVALATRSRWKSKPSIGMARQV